MSLKILGGCLKGFNLAVNDKVTKPTGVMLKRKIFDARQSLKNCLFVDLCAGSGSIGFEALSRGARRVIFVENNFLAFKNISNAINEINHKESVSKVLGKTSVEKQSADRWLKDKINTINEENSIIFFDPPYEHVQLYEIIFSTMRSSSYKGEFWVEYDLKGDKGVIKIVDDLFRDNGVKRYKHGQHEICIFQFE